MMKLGFIGRQGKTVFYIGILAAIFWIAPGLLFVTATPTIATEEQEVPDEISINNEVYKTDRKGSVLFSHSEHADGYVESCDGCHHEYKDGQNIWERKLNIAYHKNCKGCHRELAREGGTQAPYRQCTDCHEKR
jgi:hypothetical protein